MWPVDALQATTLLPSLLYCTQTKKKKMCTYLRQGLATLAYKLNLSYCLFFHGPKAKDGFTFLNS